MAKITKGGGPTYAEGTDPAVSRPTIDPMPLVVEPDEDEDDEPSEATPAVSSDRPAKKTVTGKASAKVGVKAGGES